MGRFSLVLVAVLSLFIIGDVLAEEELTLDLGDGVTMKLVLIPSGNFQMGSASGKVKLAPVHVVEITKQFFIGATEVTQAQYQAVMGENPSTFPEAQRPVEKLTWHDAVAFCEKLSEKAGRTVSYAFGDDVSQLDKYAWYSSNSGNETHPVAQKLPNAWGLYDMHGNVYEWCLDHFNMGYSDAPADGSAWTTEKPKPDMILRSGAYNTDEKRCLSAARACNAPKRKGRNSGVRVVVPLVENK